MMAGERERGNEERGEVDRTRIKKKRESDPPTERRVLQVDRKKSQREVERTKKRTLFLLRPQSVQWWVEGERRVGCLFSNSMEEWRKGTRSKKEQPSRACFMV